MAKELPYFKFEPSEWQNGNIQMFNDETKILFIDLCCTYWLRLGELTYSMAVNKHCKHRETMLNELIKAELINLKNDKLSIKFLDVQLKELKKKSRKASISAKKRWNKNSDANAMQTHMRTHSERNAKRREEKRKEENKKINKKDSGYGLPGVDLKA